MTNTGMTSKALSHTPKAYLCLNGLPREIDVAINCAHGWVDLDLDLGYRDQPNLAENDRVRFTLSDVARGGVFHRLTEAGWDGSRLNRHRYEEGQASAPAANPRASKAISASQGALALVDAPNAEPTASKSNAAAPARRASQRRSR
jgi:hypothetical protein